MQGPELRRRPSVSRSPGAIRTDPERIARAPARTTAEVGIAEMASPGPAALLSTGDAARGGGATAADGPTATARDDPERQERWSHWMADAQCGDAAAYETLLREVLPVLRRFIGRRVTNTAAAEDLVQTVLLSLHRARHTYRSEQPFEPWLWAIARNTLTDFRRQQGRRMRREEVLPEDDLLPLDLHISEALSERVRGGTSGLSPALEAALAKLPANQREAVVLLYLDGLSLLEAAIRAGVSRTALKVRVHRARRTLRRLLEQGDPR